MELDSLQQTQTTLTTSLNKTGSQKPSFLDVSYNINPTSAIRQKPSLLDVDITSSVTYQKPSLLDVYSDPTPTL